VLAGVCAALSARYGVDISLVRLAFVLFSLAWGLGVVLYAGAWFMLSGSDLQAWRSDAVRHARRARARLEEIPRAVSSVRIDVDGKALSGRTRPMLLGAGLVLFGAVVLLWSFGLFDWVTPLRAVGLGAIVLGGSALIGLTGGAR
jgi:phage shock protein PspC (stress-responsive transcriptional regulator)